MKSLGLIAGNNKFPLIWAKSARKSGIDKIATVAFKGETELEIEEVSDKVYWLRVGQLSKLIKFFHKEKIIKVVMAGQISPSQLYTFRPDWRTIKMLAKLKERNAESIFSAIARELSQEGIELISSATYMENFIPKKELVAGKKIPPSEISNIEWGFDIAKKISDMDIGQSIVIRKGTVLAVEGFDGTNATIERGGKLGKGKAILIKVAKNKQDMRFDVPVIGMETLKKCKDFGVKIIAIEANKTIILELDKVKEFCSKHKMSLMAL